MCNVVVNLMVLMCRCVVVGVMIVARVCMQVIEVVIGMCVHHWCCRCSRVVGCMIGVVVVASVVLSDCCCCCCCCCW